MPPEPHLHVVFALAGVLAAIATAYDLKTGQIPNWLTYPVLLLGPVLHVARFARTEGLGEEALTEGAFSLMGSVVCAIVPALLYRQGAIGGGDLKLLAAVGSLLQVTMGVEAQMYAFFAGTLVAPARLAYEGKLLGTLKNTVTLATNTFLPKEKRKPIDQGLFSSFRLGPAVLFGVMLVAYLHW